MCMYPQLLSIKHGHTSTIGELIQKNSSAFGDFRKIFFLPEVIPESLAYEVFGLFFKAGKRSDLTFLSLKDQISDGSPDPENKATW